jgi:hypothetical protein
MKYIVKAIGKSGKSAFIEIDYLSEDNLKKALA